MLPGATGLILKVVEDDLLVLFVNDCSFISGADPSEQTKTCMDDLHVGG